MTDQNIADQLQRLLDIEEIRSLRIRYSHVLDSGKVEGFHNVFADDAVVAVTVGKMEGIEAIKTGLAEAYETFDYRKARNYPFLHAVTNHAVTITSSSEAEGLCYLLDWVTGREKGHPVLLLGLYSDKYRRENGKWKIYHTQLDVIWQHEE
ncbi:MULTISPECIES: nuclear transport factor 2 family protein [unclassified Rhizobium]|uniref:nuclear transport factor 2 family protein n=1 Tax=unclassified Rhizobium TaxID=2613769 RepID=UPI001823CB45|nr:ketosteroid isomerase-like protein [Rhizobium sp. BK098]MBB3571179.1 ketosteroid isomerase-like protein [Rhizobium sp. BK491]MBB3617907.1 ketosteroid isomerase-like protein [Rhizobium sp. BK609]MBB3683640.1 ketosteroid isomerase-like protein [Rhizobium sp. BK612]